MEDQEIVELYFARSERAIEETSIKYEGYCYRIAYNILYNKEDSDECLNDTWLNAWNAIPPNRPGRLSTYLGKITRNIALNVYEKKHRKKRGGGQVDVVYDELEEILTGHETPEERTELAFLVTCINDYLKSLPGLSRMVFVGRYWYFESVEQIAKHLGITTGRTKSLLYRTRTGLREYLEKEGIYV